MANRDGTCRVCGWNLGGGRPIRPATLAAHLRAEPYCRTGYLELELAEGSFLPGAVLATLHIVQQGGYTHWRIVGLRADGTFATFGQVHLRRDAERLLERRRRGSRVESPEDVDGMFARFPPADDSWAYRRS